jgi:hypothetical protein
MTPAEEEDYEMEVFQRSAIQPSMKPRPGSSIQPAKAPRAISYPQIKVWRWRKFRCLLRWTSGNRESLILNPCLYSTIDEALVVI